MSANPDSLSRAYALLECHSQLQQMATPRSHSIKDLKKLLPGTISPLGSLSTSALPSPLIRAPSHEKLRRMETRQIQTLSSKHTRKFSSGRASSAASRLTTAQVLDWVKKRALNTEDIISVGSRLTRAQREEIFGPIHAKFENPRIKFSAEELGCIRNFKITHLKLMVVMASCTNPPEDKVGSLLCAMSPAQRERVANLIRFPEKIFMINHLPDLEESKKFYLLMNEASRERAFSLLSPPLKTFLSTMTSHSSQDRA